jgi:hypothetical protein
MQALPLSRVHAYLMSVKAKPAAPCARRFAVEGINAF